MSVKQQTTIDRLSKELQKDKNNIALFVTGSVARGEATNKSDLDLLLIANEKKDFEERKIDGIVVEIKTNTLKGFIAKMDENPMNIYQWFDSKLVFGDENILRELQKHAQEVMISAIPPDFPRKWLDSARVKIIAAKENKDDLNLGFQTSNVLWKIVESFYILNNLPLPPATTALKKIPTLEILPENFEELWKETLTGNLNKRSDATLELINFLLK